MSSLSEPPEAEMAADLVRRIHAGDTSAEQAFVTHYRPRLLYALARLVNDPSETEDFANEALFVAIQQLRDKPIDDPTRLGGYAYGIARNLLRNAQRKTRRESDADPQFFSRFASAGADQAQLLDQIEVARIVRQVVDTVDPPRYREILLRYYVQDEDKDSICKHMDLSALHFNRVLFRARQAFKKLMQDHASRPALVASGVLPEDRHE